MIKRFILGFVVLALLVGGYVAYRAATFTDATPSTEHRERILQIPKGAAVPTIARLLHDAGVITDARLFGWFVRYRGAAPKVKAGEFRFYTDMTPAQVLDVLVKGEEVRYKLTFPEGYNIRDMAGVVSSLPFLNRDHFLTLASDPDAPKRYGIDAPTLEGFLFPSTYELPRSQNEKDLIDAMVRQLKARWTPEFDTRAKALGMSQLQVITLASIVEKETGDRNEQPMVASVFHNRLKKGMKLESDPTIIYGLKDYAGDIRRSDIHRAHPWNTYVIPGLPPSPIANPGEGAIRATLWPAESDYLYFVAKGDRTHTFSRTYAEHAAKVIEYQIRRKGTFTPPGSPSVEPLR